MLTDTRCRNAKPKDRPYRITDGKGLHLAVEPTGTKSWRYRFELCRDGERKESVFVIGHYASAPTGETEEQAKARRAGRCFTLAEAREERAKARALVRQGINPAHQRQQDRIQRDREHANTFEVLAAEWLALRDWEEVTKARRLDMLRRVVFPQIGSLPVRKITPAHVLDVLDTAVKNNGPSVAAEARRTMSAVFDFAVATLRADTDPTYPVRKALPANKTQHKRPLTAEEIWEFLRDLAGYERNFQTVAAFRLMWLTLCRPSEVMGARWEEFDLEAAIWRIPPERMKKRKEHVVPLPRQAVELLRAVQGVTGHRGHVFPNRDDRNKPMTDATLRQALAYLRWSGRYSPHATRTTGSTRLNEMGYPPDWIERQLAHAEPNAVRRTYDHSSHFASRAKMMQVWADYLDSLKTGAEVVPLSERKM
jgi:integrase